MLISSYPTLYPMTPTLAGNPFISKKGQSALSSSLPSNLPFSLPELPPLPSPSTFLPSPGLSDFKATETEQLTIPAAQPLVMQPADRYKLAGDEFRKTRQYPEAARAYQQAINSDPSHTAAYFNYAQLQLLTGDVPGAILHLQQLLQVDPKDHDARVMLGRSYERAGNSQAAKKCYLDVLAAKPDFDPAKRRLNYMLYLDQKRFYPETAESLHEAQRREVIFKARKLLKTFFTQHHPNPMLLRLSQETPITFQRTQQVDESSNIAEYDFHQGVIRIQPQMTFSSANVIAAYIAHELRHAIDQDTLTSIREEQDGYNELARFWKIYKGAEDEPNLDRALTLYEKGPQYLNQEVERVYTIRDNDIPELSPGHGLPPPNAAGHCLRAI